MLLWIGLGLGAIFLLMGGMKAFERAKITTVKSFAVWFVALAGLTLTVLLFLTGRGGIALGGLTLFDATGSFVSPAAPVAVVATTGGALRVDGGYVDAILP